MKWRHRSNQKHVAPKETVWIRWIPTRLDGTARLGRHEDDQPSPIKVLTIIKQILLEAHEEDESAKQVAHAEAKLVEPETRALNGTVS